ncbi:MAG TPA: sigma-70 family RNA polymerase sigma factor [Solirubrobacter sp.]|nr:sigma-70 family RNA polymerase sigma factor [Solirubrobacter sp.]
MTASAEILVERDYERLKPSVLRTLRYRLRARGLHLDETDLDAFYNQAWHGLYVRLAAGEEVASPQGLLITIAERRAIDEARALHLDRRGRDHDLAELATEPDLEAGLDDRVRFRQFTQGLRERLSERERQAALLCYVHDYTRPEAATALGVSRRRMEKIMDRVSKQTGALVAEIERGEWCDSRSSLIKAYALGLLDANGGRHALAVAHLQDCPACRARVRGIRGIAAFGPPLPVLLGAAAAGGVVPRRRPRPRTQAAVAAVAGVLAAAAFAADRIVTGPPVPPPVDADARRPPPSPSAVPSAPAATPKPARPKRRKPKRRAARRASTPPIIPPAATVAPPPATPVPTPPPSPPPARDHDGAGEFELR